MPKVTDEHRENVRRQLLDATYTCLIRSDFQDVTTRDILKVAELSTGTLYNYFRSKEHLYSELAKEMLSQDVRRLTDETTTAQDTGSGLARFLASDVFNGPTVAMALSHFRGVANGEEALWAIRNLNEFILESFLPYAQKAQEEGSVHPWLDTRALVELVDIVWDGLGRRALQNSFQTSYKEVGEMMLAVLVGGALTSEAASEVAGATADSVAE